MRSVELRMPSFSMSLGRYVSTGFGPTSSAVGMFEPVTITRSTSAAANAGAGEGFSPDATDTDKSVTATPAAKATPPEPGLAWGFISDPKRPTNCDYVDQS